MEEGVKLLDTVDPLWYDKIDLDTLDMSQDRRCVLGQLYGNFWSAMQKLFPEAKDYWALWSIAVERGFGTQILREYDALQTAWREAILSRRNQS